jgi:hypothetical protein
MSHNLARALAFRCSLLLSFAAISVTTQAQSADPNAQSQPAPQKSLADIAKEQRNGRDGSKSAPSDPGATPAQSAQGDPKSLADIARERQTNRQREVKVTEKDVELLFTELDRVLEFAAQDSGLVRRSSVKHQLVGQDDVTQHMTAALSGSEEVRRMTHQELLLKKFGYLPRDFSLKTYLVGSSAKEIAGYYDLRTKTMNLLNWVGLEEQRPIMAHELTHALQDQNYNLLSWERPSARQASLRVDKEDAAESAARKAVIEGQAMLVFFDYLLKPYGRTLGDTPRAVEMIQGRIAQTYDSPITVAHAPLLLKDSAMFPYREGLLFELALLRKGGVPMAFAGAFERPPANTHEILEPQAYLEGEKTPTVSIPDLSSVLGSSYEAYDSGSIGQLDARILSQELGSENDMFTIAPNWQGGAFVAVKRKPAAGATNALESTAEISLLYVSRWKTHEAAQRFIDVYQKSLPKRVQVVDQQPWIPSACLDRSRCQALQATRVNTSEGPVFLELLPKNTVFITHSFAEDAANNLRQAVLLRGGENPVVGSAGDLSLRLFDLPVFQAFQSRLSRHVIESFEDPQMLSH